MKDWITKKLGEVCEIQIGGTPSRNNSAFWDDEKSSGNLWVSIRDLNQKIITQTAEQISDLGIRNSNAKLVPKDTILLSFKLTIGKVAFAGQDLFTNEAIAALVTDKIDNQFLYFGLQHWDLLQDVDQAIKGATLNKEKLKKLKITFPKTVDAQTKIAAVLSSVDKAIEQTEKLIEKQKRIKRGLLHDLLTKGIDENGAIRSEATHVFKDSPLGRIPKDWEVRELHQCADAIDPQPDHRTPPDVADGFPYVGISDVLDNGEIDLRLTRKVSEEAFLKQRKRFVVSDGDIIFGKIGTIGMPKKLLAKIDFALSANVILIKPNENKEFFYWMLVSPLIEKQVLNAIHTTSQPAFGMEKIRKLRLIYPSPTEQKVIAEKLDINENLLKAERKKLFKLKRIKKGLMQDLLTESAESRISNLL